MIDHVSIQCADVERSAAFYDAALAPLGEKRIMQFGPVIGFAAADVDTVDAFFRAAVAAGAEVLHEPRKWPEYHPGYYGAFGRDPDGNNGEAVCHRD